MGWTVLYIAFGFVALWLLAEVLLQNKARLRWRLVAFAGFAGVVAGVLLSSVPVIGVGAAAFAVGQTLVTLSFRRGFDAGWALRKKPAVTRRRGGAERPAEEPALRVTALDYDADTSDDAADGMPSGAGHGQDPAETAAFPAPFGGDAYAAPYGEQSATGYPEAAYYDPQQPAGGHQDPYGVPYAATYDYGTGEQPAYPAYSDPYIGTGGATQPDAQGYAAYAPQPDPYFGAGQDTYQSYQDPYTSHQYAMDTPPGGVWVPAQRDVEPQAYPAGPGQVPEQGQEQGQAYPYQGTGEYEQYRY
ncbi:hypothetical protein ACM614_08495 [Streptomyces sp. 12297]